jgi:GNAT superfamily N-acetyltransferase
VSSATWTVCSSRAGERGRSVGRLLVDAVAQWCREHGLGELQWQTPVWNEDAIRFYRQLGASDRAKAQFTLPCEPGATRRWRSRG